MSMQITAGISQNVVVPNKIETYGAIILPPDMKRVEESAKVQNNAKTTNSLKNKITSAFKKAGQGIKNAIIHPVQTTKTLAKYMTDNREQIVNTVGSKFSGIAVAQALINGKVTSKEALDYLFMGFAPALGVQGSLMGYSGLSQMKDALSNGSIDVGSFISGFSRTLKGGIDLKDMLTKKNMQASVNVILLDLTISHSENYQSETPDRRVQNGQSLNEYIHNMPETFTVNCALQEGKRYSKAEFRTIMQEIRNEKRLVQLVLGDEIFDDLALTDFSPNHDCSKSGMDYTLSFKKVIQSNIDTETEVTIMETPELMQDGDNITTTTGGAGGLDSNTKNSAKNEIYQYISGDDIKSLYAETENGKVPSMIRALMISVGDK